MKETKKINDIVFFTFIDNDIFYATQDSLYCNYKLYLSQIESNLIEFSKYNGCYCLLFTSGNGYIAYEDKQLFKLPYWCDNTIICNNLIAVYEYDYSLLTSLNNVYDVLSNQLIFSEWKKGRCFVINPNIYIYIYQKDISWFNLNLAKNQHFSFSNFPSHKNYRGEEIEADIRQIIGIYNNILWLHIRFFHIVGIDIETGQMIYHIENAANFLGLNEKEASDFGGLDYHLDEQNGIIKAFAYRYYFELDLNTLQGKIKKDFGEDFQTSWRINRSRSYPNDKNLYFIGARRGEAVNRAVGIFDTETCKIVWYDEPLEEKKFLFFTNAPQANDKYLGVLDSENNLRIYER